MEEELQVMLTMFKEMFPTIENDIILQLIEENGKLVSDRRV